MTNGNNNGMGKPIRYRSVTPANKPQASTLVCGVYRVPAHVQSGLAIKWAALFLGSARLNAATDLIRAHVYIDQQYTNIAVISGNSPQIPITSFSWAPPFAATTEALNPPGLAGMIFPDPLTLAPIDDPCWFLVYDSNQSTGVTQAQWDNSSLVLHGWEIPTLDLGTFPAPSSVEAVI